MKIAITGRGCKTTLASLLAHISAQDEERVLAIDADPEPLPSWTRRQKWWKRPIWQRLRKGDPASTEVEGMKIERWR